MSAPMPKGLTQPFRIEGIMPYLHQTLKMYQLICANDTHLNPSLDKACAIALWMLDAIS